MDAPCLLMIGRDLVFFGGHSSNPEHFPPSVLPFLSQYRLLRPPGLQQSSQLISLGLFKGAVPLLPLLLFSSLLCSCRSTLHVSGRSWTGNGKSATTSSWSVTRFTPSGRSPDSSWRRRKQSCVTRTGRWRRQRSGIKWRSR